MKKNYVKIPDWFQALADTTMISGIALLFAGLFDILFLIVEFIIIYLFGLNVYPNMRMLGLYMIFQMILTFLVLNKNLKFDWGLD
jgi:hypothetical protein